MATKKTSGRKRSTSGASEYVREEMHEVGKGRVKNPKQAVAIGLSRARRAGEDVPPPKRGKTSAATRKKAESDYKAGRKKRATKKSTAKKSAMKKRAVKKTSTKKSATKKSTTKKSTTKKSTTKKSTTKKSTTKKSASKRRS
jgi:hypothetical protein